VRAIAGLEVIGAIHVHGSKTFAADEAIILNESDRSSAVFARETILLLELINL
jgi:hypothetical protein